MKRIATVLMWSTGLVTGGWLAGCAIQKSETGNRKPEVNKVEIPSPENFTTLGKPTKTIQTLNGPVEVYDPTQDPEVRVAFEVVYEKGDKDLFITDSEIGFGYGDYVKKLDAHSPEVRLLRRAMKYQRESYAREGCRIIDIPECGSFWQVRTTANCPNNLHGNCPISIVKNQANTRSRCGVGGVAVFDRTTHPIGRYFFSSLEEEVNAAINNEKWPKPAPSYQRQFNNFFAAHCRTWSSTSSQPKP